VTIVPAAALQQPRHSGRIIAAVAFTFSLMALACGGSQPAAAPPATAPVTAPAPVAATAPPTPPAATLLAAGDIASCSSTGDEATAALLDTLVAAHPDAVVAPLGDLAYEQGTAEEFARCYDPAWGRYRAQTRPATGNHDAASGGTAAYAAYFGVDRWYSYELGAWHVVVLDSNCGGTACAAGSEQERWLRADLAAHPGRCTLAYWHHPRFSSGSVHGSETAVAPLFQALFDAGADVVLAGHEHNYERFAPLDPTGRPNEAAGIRSFVVGTGGRSHYPFGRPLAGSEVRNADAFGVISLTLSEGGYQWEFVPVAGESFTDRGIGNCH
jgi:3',5'-cyclic AMP phosphodiesterase CpdA